jgi:uncharacterized membrane protein
MNNTEPNRSKRGVEERIAQLLASTIAIALITTIISYFGYDLWKWPDLWGSLGMYAARVLFTAIFLALLFVLVHGLRKLI